MPPKGSRKSRAEDVSGEPTASETNTSSKKSKASRKPKKGNTLAAAPLPEPMDWFEGSGSGALFFALDPTIDYDAVSMISRADFPSLGACATVCKLSQKMIVNHPMWRQLYSQISDAGLKGHRPSLSNWGCKHFSRGKLSYTSWKFVLSRFLSRALPRSSPFPFFLTRSLAPPHLWSFLVLIHLIRFAICHPP